MIDWTTSGRPSISVPSLGRVSSGVHELAKVILRMSPGEFLWRAILERPVRGTLIILLPPGLDPFFGIVEFSTEL